MAASETGSALQSEFEDHCWQDVIPPEVLTVYAKYAREVHVGPAPALLAVDLYENVYGGGALPVVEAIKTYPSSCGEYAWAAIEPTKRLFAAARGAGLPIFYPTSDSRAAARPRGVGSTKRATAASGADPACYAIRPEFKPQPGDVVITKQRASGFFGTPLMSHFTKLGVCSVIICGESTSGCVRATAVDAQSWGLHVVLVEECCFDRSLISHKINLFDMHHKYADVMKLAAVVDHLDGLAVRQAG
jgi:nicotinamidase-related amidase